MAFKLFTYGEKRLAGIRSPDVPFDLGKAARLAALPDLVDTDVDVLISRWDNATGSLAQLDRLLTADPGRFASAALDDNSLVVHAPLQRPGTIYAAGANYRDHVEAMGRASGRKLVLNPKAEQIPPWHFIKGGRSTLSGHRGTVTCPTATQSLDYEAELAVVIGRRAFQVGVGEALDFVAGYTCANDLSSRDTFVRHKVDPLSPFHYDWVSHKCFEGSCPMGPVFTPASSVPDPENLNIRLWLNGELRQDSNTRNHLYGVAEQIAHLSQRVALLPGDILLTGTPAGVGMEIGVFLKRGDAMKVWIEGIGELETHVI